MRNLYKLLAIRLIINLSDSLFYVVTIWWAANDLHSAAMSGVLVALFSVPDMLQVFMGPLVDRYQARHILMFASVIQLVDLTVLLLVLRLNNPILVAVLAFISAMASALTYPIEDVLIPQVAPPQKMIFANSLFSVSYSVMDSIFNAVSGFLLAFFSIFALYKVDLLLYMVAVIPILLFRYTNRTESNDSKFDVKSYFTQLKTGGEYLLTRKILMEMSIPLIFLNFFNSFTAVALPYYSRTFEHPSVVFGVLSTATGLGGIVGSAAVNFFARKITAGKIIASFLILNGISWCLAIFSHEILVTTLLMFLSYVFSGIYNIIFSSLYQAIPPLNILGRVNTTVDSLITMAMPLGGLVAGYVLRVSSVQVVISSFGVCAIIAGIFYLFQKWFMSLPLTNEVLRDKA